MIDFVRFPVRDLSDIAYSDSGDCPICGREPEEGFYRVGDENYPQCYNSYYAHRFGDPIFDFDEVHCCPVCKKEFYFKNGY